MPDRRTSKKDLLTLSLKVAALLGWITIFAVQITGWMAAPEFNTGIVRYHELNLRSHWEKSWVDWLPFLLGACTLFSLFALGVNPIRSRRKEDPKRIHLVILLVLTLTGYGFYWFQILSNTA